jgi:LuxR family transcriptional regulator, maltose regulon positive regulatory protein
MARTTPTVRDGLLEWQVAGARHTLPIGSAAWFAWLEQATTFAFVTPQGSMTVRRDRGQRGGWYWRAYRRTNGVLRQVYLGKRELVTEERLVSAAAALIDSSVEQAVQAARPLAGEDSLPAVRAQPAQAGRFVLQRPALLTRLNEAQARQRVTLLIAPVASGKTMLLSGWAEQAREQQRTIAWLSLEANDNDPVRFGAAVRAALSAAHPTLRRDRGSEQLPLALIDQLNQLTDDMVSLGQPLTLVLDEYHQINEHQIHSSLARWIATLPRHIHLIIASRVAPPWPLQRMQLQGDLHLIQAVDLYLSSTESATYLRMLLGYDPPSNTLHRLITLSEGWIGGLHLAALTLRDQQGEPFPLSGHSLQHPGAFLSAEVLSHLPASTRSFLLAIAFLDRLCGPLCVAITAEAESGLLLEQLAREHMVLVALNEPAGWYRWHHLVGPWVREQAASQPIARRHQQSAAAVAWLAEAGLLSEAIHYALLGEHYPTAAELLARHGDNWLARGEIHTLRGWLDRLPPELLAATPRLLLIHMQALMLERRWECIEPQLRALPPLPPSPPPAALVMLHCLGAVIGGQIERAEVLLMRLEQPALAADPFLQQLAHMLSGAVAWARGDQLCAQQHFAALGTTALTHNGHQIALLALAHQGHFHAVGGQLDLALICYQQVLTQTATLSGGELVRGMALMGAGQLWYERNELRQAADAARQAAALGQRWDNQELQGPAVLLLTQIELAQGDATRAWQRLDTFETLLRQRSEQGSGLLHLALGRAEVALTNDLPQVAASWLTGVAHLLTTLPAGSTAYRAQRLQVRVLLAQGALEEAAGLLQQLQQAAESRHRLSDLVPTLVLAACLAEAQGQRKRALELFSAAVTSGAGGGYVQSIVVAGPMVGPLLHALALPKALQPYGMRIKAALAQCSRAQQRTPATLLSEREQLVLALIAQGASNREIAERLIVTTSTVKKHLSSIYQKLNVTNRTQALIAAQRQGWLNNS